MADPIPGEIRVLASETIPPGWAACNGQTLKINDYRDLYAIIGTTYGGDGKQTFALPDLRGRVAMHSYPGKLNSGSTGGETAHQLTSTEVPGHAHGSLGLISTASSSGGFHLASAPASGPIGGTMTVAVADGQSSGAAHDNIQPHLTMTFVIALHGVWPSRK